MAVNTLSANFSGDITTYIAKKLLSLALKRLVMYQLCEKVKMPAMHGRTIQYTRYERVQLPFDPLTESVTPGDTAMSITVVTAVLDQWGAVIPLSDVAIDSVTHPVLQQAIQLASLQASETLDREAIKVALTGTNVVYGGGSANRTAVQAADVMTTDLAGAIVADLRDYGAIPFGGGDELVGVAGPYVMEDIQKDTKFLNAAQYSAIKKLFVNEIGTWKGIRWIRSNFIPYVQEGNVAAQASSSVAGGALTGGTTYDFKIVIRDILTGFELFIGPVEQQATAGGEGTVRVQMPAALPAAANAGSLCTLYFGTNGGTLYKQSAGNALSANVDVISLPTSGDVAPATPNADDTYVHFTFVLGKQALMCSELNRVKAMLTPKQPSDSDPLMQRRKIGWKTDFKVFIANENFLTRAETSSTNK